MLVCMCTHILTYMHAHTHTPIAPQQANPACPPLTPEFQLLLLDPSQCPFLGTPGQ